MTTKVWKMGMAVDQLIADTVDLSDKEFGKYVSTSCFIFCREIGIFNLNTICYIMICSRLNHLIK